MPSTSPVRTPAALTPIPVIQGSGSLSPLEGKSIVTSGVITAVQTGKKDAGFFLQDLKGDGNAATSDGLFVSTLALDPEKRAKFDTGSVVQVTGSVTEQNDMTTIAATEAGIQAIKGAKKLSDESMPSPVTLQLPHGPTVRSGYLEAREGMLTTIPNALVLSPMSKYGTFTVVDESGHGPARDLDGKNAAQRLQVSSKIGPHTGMMTGDRVTGISGPLSFSYGDYQLLQTGYYKEVERGPYPPKMWGDLDGNDKIDATDLAGIKKLQGKPAFGPLDPADVNGDGKVNTTDVTQAKARAAKETGAPTFSVATMNVENFFDSDDAPPPVDDTVVSKNEYNAKLARIASSIREQLKFPDMIALQEVENTHVLEDLVNRPEMKAMGYKFSLLPTIGHRSINPALLYRGDRVDVTDVRQVQKDVPIDDAVSGGTTSGNGASQSTGPLFSRQPLLVDLTVHGDTPDQKEDLTVIVNHLISKFSPKGLPTDPIRINQAKYLNQLVGDLRAKRPDREIVVLGDMNDTPASKAMKALKGTAKTTKLVPVLEENIPAGERWSYNYEGQSELIDHILTTPGLAQQVERAGVRHYNADLPSSLGWGTGPNRATDHDTPYAQFRFPAPAAVAPAPAQAAEAAKLVKPRKRA